MPMPLISLVAAVARDGGIGRDNDLLVRLPGDLPRFKRMTMGSPILMGRKTWDSIGRPLPGRTNLVLTRDRSWQAEGASAVASLDDALVAASAAERLFVIGGAAVYALALPRADALELTEIDAVFPADVFFPAWNRADFRQTSREVQATPQGMRYAYVTYRRNDSGDS